MIKTKNFNNFPENSKLNIKPLGKDETAMFRLINTYSPAAKKYFLRSELMPSQDFVIDPDTSVGYHIACIKSVSPDEKTVTFHEIWFEQNNVDIIRLHGNSAVDQEVYHFAKISNFNGKNIHRDPQAPIYFEEVDKDTDVILPRTVRKNKRAALNIIDHLNDAEITAFLKNSRLMPLETEELRRNQIEDFAEQFPDLVLRAGSYSADDMARDVNRFIEANLIVWNKDSSGWVDVKSGQIFYKTGKSFQSNAMQDVVKFFMGNDTKYFKYQREYLDMKTAKGESIVTFEKPNVDANVELIGDNESEILKPTNSKPKKFKKAFAKAAVS